LRPVLVVTAAPGPVDWGVARAQADEGVGMTVFERRPAFTFRGAHAFGDLIEERLTSTPPCSNGNSNRPHKKP
jgi:hypothetical protein